MVSNLGIEAEVLKMLGDDRGLEFTVTETLAGGFVVIELLEELGETPLNEGLTGDLRVVLGEPAAPFASMMLDKVARRPRIGSAYTSYWKVFLYF